MDATANRVTLKPALRNKILSSPEKFIGSVFGEVSACHSAYYILISQFVHQFHRLLHHVEAFNQDSLSIPVT